MSHTSYIGQWLEVNTVSKQGSASVTNIPASGWWSCRCPAVQRICMLSLRIHVISEVSNILQEASVYIARVAAVPIGCSFCLCSSCCPSSGPV